MLIYDLRFIFTVSVFRNKRKESRPFSQVGILVHYKVYILLWRAKLGNNSYTPKFFALKKLIGPLLSAIATHQFLIKLAHAFRRSFHDLLDASSCIDGVGVDEVDGHARPSIVH